MRVPGDQTQRRDRNRALIAITLGADGTVVFDGQRYPRVAAPKVRPIGMNGAGDMFAGAYLPYHFRLRRGCNRHGLKPAMRQRGW
ncbi:MAG: hypothetical protein IPI75_17145 [Gammaproteobacteria bacterium]|nr:hypothetical protein [Gammaproteobacteria bacterium]